MEHFLKTKLIFLRENLMQSLPPSSKAPGATILFPLAASQLPETRGCHGEGPQRMHLGVSVRQDNAQKPRTGREKTIKEDAPRW